MLILFVICLTLTIQASASELCLTEVGTDIIEITSIRDTNFPDEAEWEWQPNEERTIEVKTKNKNHTKTSFKLELYLLNGNLNIQENFTTISSDTTKTISIDKDKTTETQFSFQLRNAESGEYSLYAKLYDSSNESICTELKAIKTSKQSQINIAEQQRRSMVKKIHGTTNVTAGTNYTYIIEVINLGNIPEDKVLVTAYNKELGIRQDLEITTLGIKETKNISFTFSIPKNTTAAEERIAFTTEYDYNENSGLYSQMYDRDKSLDIKITATTQATSQPTNTTPEASSSAIVPYEEPDATPSDQKSTTRLILLITVITLLIITVTAITYFYLKNKKAEPEIQTTQTAKYISDLNKTTPPSPPNKPS